MRYDSSPLVRTLIIVGVVIAAALTIYTFTPYYSTQIFWELRKTLFWAIPIVVFLILAFLAAAFWEDFRVIAATLTLATIAVFLDMIAMWFMHGYWQDQQYAKSVQVSQDDLPQMGVRTPFSVAQAQSRTTLANTPGADLLTETTMFDPAKDDFTTLAKGRSFFGNYAAVAVQRFPLTGRSQGSQCDFSEKAQRMLGGFFSHNLGRAINSAARGVNWSDSDAYGLCREDGTPLVIVPLKRQVGLLVVTEIPAGVAVYDGHSGTVTIQTDTSHIPGPVYPLSLADKQRESTAAMGSWMQWARSQIGWKAAEGEVNSSNSSEFILGRKSGGTVYVTPLSNQGNSTGIAAVSELEASSMTAGQLNPIKVHKFSTPWVSVDAIESRIKADYQDIPNWQTLRVQEIAPVDGKRWIATLGNDQNTLYRVEGTGDLSQFPGSVDPAIATCLFQGTDSKPRRCGTLALIGQNGIGGQYGPNTPGGNPTAGQTTPPTAGLPALATMSDQQLAELLRQVADELSRRASTPTPGR